MTDASFGDFIQSFQIGNLDIRGRLLRLNTSLSSAIDGHDYPPALAGLVGETMALTATLASALKYDGVFTLQAQGNGPVPLCMADITSDGAMRAYARLREGASVDGMEGVSVPQLMGAGHLAFTVDQGADMDRYQGITELAGATMADCAQNYFRTSEQLETAIAIVSDTATPGDARAAALMIQRLPTDGDGIVEEEDWRRAVILMSSITSAELLDASLDATQILLRLYHEDGIRLLEHRDLHHECRCSGDRVRRTLLSFPRDEIADMADEGMITVTCEFCRTDYVYGIAELDALFAQEGEPS